MERSGEEEGEFACVWTIGGSRGGRGEGVGEDGGFKCECEEGRCGVAGERGGALEST